MMGAQEKNVTVICYDSASANGLFKQIMCSEFAEFLSWNYSKKEIVLSWYDTKIILLTQDQLRWRTFEKVIIDEMVHADNELLNTIKCHTL